MTTAEFNALKEFAALFRAEVESHDPIREARMRHLFNSWKICRQALFDVIQTEGVRKPELDAILHQISPNKYPRPA
jgi:hypothetical protein